MKEIKSYIIDSLSQEIRLYKEQMTKNKKALQNPYPVDFSVEIISLWRTEGEKTVITKGETIDVAMESAINQFLEINKRKDIQGTFYVKANLQNGVKVEIPKKYWHHTLKGRTK